jgi:predicted nucleic acid-binding protein
LPTHEKVVSNTTPILALLRIEKLDLLRELYGRIMVPEAVYNEIEAGKNTGIYMDIATLDWISIEKIQNAAQTNPPPELARLDLGETEAIMLTLEQNADLLIIDEKHGRECANCLNIPITGTVGVLLRAKQRGMIPEIAPLLERLVSAHSWLNKHLIADALALANE